ncbi:MAG: membrane protein insertase YidC [Campylobacteraceae bacterium]|nr:membrane protein insertase YidC [Campylobacteraceae bacterium]
MNNPNNSNPGMQKRMLLMTVIVFASFFAYEYFVLGPQNAKKSEEQKAMQAQQQQLSPQTNATPNLANNSAPSVGTTPQVSSIDVPTNKTLAPNSIVTTITTAKNIIEIDTLGRVAQVTLLEKQYIDEDNNQIKLFDVSQLRPLEVRFSNRSINDEAFKTSVVASASTLDATKKSQKLVLTQTLSDTVLTKTLTIYPDGHYDVDIETTNSQNFFVTAGFRPNVLVDMYADHGVIVKLGDGTTQIFSDEDLDKTETFNNASFASAFDRYYATVLYSFTKPLTISLMPDNDENPQIFIHGNSYIHLSGYMGPKEFESLSALNPELEDVIEYGFFTFIAKPMFTFLNFLHGYIGNWGWTIVALTLLIKLALYPLSYKGMVSMQKLKDLAPKVKEIQAKYKNDKQKASMHMMELYKKHGANPMGGCLPIVLQIPVFFAIYRVLLNSIELKGSEWIFWITDLALMDPFFVLPVLMGATMYLQQKITPNTMQDEMQKKIFQFLPIIFTFFFLWFPAGLTLYWFINNVFTVSQQYYINKLFDKRRKEKSVLAK